MTDLLAGALLVLAAVLALVAGVAQVRFPDTFTRLHASSKPAVLGVVLAAVAAALRQDDAGTVATLALVAVFQVLTAPLAAHVVARAAHRTGEPLAEEIVVDELTDPTGPRRGDGG